jgi:glycosyltransferase involved in cell wall biosynthesis
VLYLQPCTTFGGAERQASIVSPRLEQWGLEVLPLVGPGTTVVDLLREQGVTEIVHSRSFPGGWSPPRGWERALEPLRFYRAIRAVGAEVEALIIERKIDLVMAAMPFSWLAATAPARRRRVPIVWRAGGTRIRDIEKPLLRIWSGMHPPDLLLCCSQAVHDTFSPLIPAPAEVVDNGVELDRFDPADASPERYRPPGARLVVGFAARLAPEKRPQDFIDMVARLQARFPDVHFLMAGDGGEWQSCQRRARERGLSDTFRLMGYVSDMRSFYAACDVLALPSRTEGLPNMVLESMAMQKALVVSDRAARTGVVRNEREALVHRVDDVAALTSCVERLLLSDTLRESLAQRARERVQRAFDARQSARRIAELLRTVVEHERASVVGRFPLAERYMHATFPRL